MDLCHDDAYCTDTIGNYNCTCNTGYEGNGFNCTSNSLVIIVIKMQVATIVFLLQISMSVPQKHITAIQMQHVRTLLVVSTARAMLGMKEMEQAVLVSVSLCIES